LNKNASLDSEKDYNNNIYYFILSALLGGHSMKKLNLMIGSKDN
jgi:hypothetical protein